MSGRRRRSLTVSLLTIGALFILSIAWPTETGRSQSHWTVGLKAGSLLGLGGVALEHETDASAVLVNLGFADGRQTLLLSGRRYGSAQPGNRTYLDARLGVMRVGGGTTADWVSLFAFGAGYEAPLLGIVRLTIETGVGLQNIEPSFTPLTRAGIFLGGTAGIRF